MTSVCKKCGAAIEKRKPLICDPCFIENFKKLRSMSPVELNAYVKNWFKNLPGE